MAKIIQMKLAFVGAGAPAPAANVCDADCVVSDTSADFDAMALRQGIVSCITDPCKGCVYFGLCDADDCAQHLFDLDVNDPYLDCQQMWYFVEKNGKCVKACKRLESACSHARKLVRKGSCVCVGDSSGNRYSMRTGRLM